MLAAVAGSGGRASQAQLVESLAVDRATVRRNCQALERAGELTRAGLDKSGSNHGSTVWRLSSSSLTVMRAAQRPRQLSSSMIRGHMAVLRALFADAVEEGVLRSNPAAGVRIALDGGSPGAEASVRRALTRDELRRFLSEVTPEWRLFFEVLAQTGVRIGEAVELRPGVTSSLALGRGSRSAVSS